MLGFMYKWRSSCKRMKLWKSTYKICQRCTTSNSTCVNPECENTKGETAIDVECTYESATCKEGEKCISAQNKSIEYSRDLFSS